MTVQQGLLETELCEEAFRHLTHTEGFFALRAKQVPLTSVTPVDETSIATAKKTRNNLVMPGNNKRIECEKFHVAGSRLDKQTRSSLECALKDSATRERMCLLPALYSVLRAQQY